ncbi:glycosyltransferase [Nocardioides convexus]|uniref:glycosyltransferase family 4 protein n=1 Tax=Nocardioides convexus TaxID=2712224 RepID=UPI0024184FDC|nr:glycosyltransferase [Nocardioides convexus]
MAALGHTVEVFSGQPYPEPGRGRRPHQGAEPGPLPAGRRVPQPAPERVPRPGGRGGVADHAQRRLPRAAHVQQARGQALLRARRDDFDIVFDNQTLALPLLEVEDRAGVGLPLAATIHHPIIMDRRIGLAAAVWAKRKPRSRVRFEFPKIGVWRWYSFLGQQKRTAPRLRRVIVPSESSKRDVVREFGVDPARIETILLGVDDRFVPPSQPRVPGRILAMASADAPLKGISVLLEAFAKPGRRARPGVWCSSPSRRRAG